MLWSPKLVFPAGGGDGLYIFRHAQQLCIMDSRCRSLLLSSPWMERPRSAERMFLLALMIKHKQAPRERVAGGHCGRPMADIGLSFIKPAIEQSTVFTEGLFLELLLQTDA